jgi:uncharacterized protein (TIGR02246 family)
MIPSVSEADVRALGNALITGWNDHDGAAMAAPFADDGVVIGFDGSVASGKDTISTEMTQIFADHETGRYAVKVRNIRSLGVDAMLLRAIAGLVPPGKSAINPETNSHQTVVAERQDGRWQIVLFQNTAAQFHGRPELVDEMTSELQAIADASRPPMDESHRR